MYMSLGREIQVVQLRGKNFSFAVMSTSSVSEMSDCQRGRLTALAATQFNLGERSMTHCVQLVGS